MPAQCCRDFWKSIPEDTPVFILVGYDSLAPEVIAFWLRLAKAKGVNTAKRVKAEKHLQAVIDFQANHLDKVKLPD